jgi:hypothetical protein
MYISAKSSSIFEHHAEDRDVFYTLKRLCQTFGFGLGNYYHFDKSRQLTCKNRPFFINDLGDDIIIF